jgi:hypothetical protein
MAKNFEKLIFGGLHEKHAVTRGIWVPTQHSLWDQGKPRKTLIELADGIRHRASFRVSSEPRERETPLLPSVVAGNLFILWNKPVSRYVTSMHSI